MSDELQLFGALLEGDWDQVEDLKGFVTPPIGTYIFRTTKCEVGTNKNKDKGAINLIAEIAQIVELQDSSMSEEDQKSLIGASTGTGFVGTFGLSKFKEAFKGISDELGLSTPAQTIEALSGGLELAVTVGHRVDRDNLDDEGNPKVYPVWKTVILAS